MKVEKPEFLSFKGFMSDLWLFDMAVNAETSSPPSSSSLDDSPSTSDNEESESESNTGAIIGAAIAGVVVIAGSATVAFLIFKRRSKKEPHPQAEEMESKSDPKAQSGYVAINLEGGEKQETGYAPITTKGSLPSISQPRRNIQLNRKFEIDYSELAIGDPLGNGVKSFFFTFLTFFLIISISFQFLNSLKTKKNNEIPGIWNSVSRDMEANALCNQSHQQIKCH
jgi:hypothetical protein